MFIRSEQDKEPEQEILSEVVGPVATADSPTDGMQFICMVLNLLLINVVRP